MYPVIKGRGAAFLPLSPRFAVLPSGPLTFVGCNKEEVVVDNKKLAGESELITPVLSMPVCHTGGRSLMLRKSMSTNLDEVNRRRREQGHAELDPTEGEFVRIACLRVYGIDHEQINKIVIKI